MQKNSPRLIAQVAGRYALAVGFVAAAYALTLLIRSDFSTPMRFFFAAVVGSAWFAGRGPGWFSVILGTVAVEYFFEPPVSFVAEFAAFSVVANWITSRGKQAEDALKHARDDLQKKVEERTAELRQMIDAIPAMVGTTSPEGTPDFINKQWQEYTGLPSQQGLGDRWTAVIHPDDLAGTLEAWRAGLASGEAFAHEARLRRADGQYRWFLLRASPWRSESARLVKWYGTATDIEDLKRAEAALRSSEKSFRLIVDSIPGCVNTTTAVGEIELANQQLLEYVGKTVEELKDWRPLVHPDDLALAIARWGHSVETGNPYDDEHRLRRADGVYRWFHVRALPLRDAADHIVRWYVLLTDIEDRKRAEAALRASEQSFRLIVDSVPGLVATMTAAGEVELVNQRILDYMGKTLEELNDWARLIHPDHRERTAALWSRSVETGDPYEIEHRIRGADGEYHWFQTRGLALRDTEGRIVRWYILLSNSDDRKRAEEALRASEHDLRLIIDSIPGFVFIVAADGKFEYVNQRILDATGKCFADLADFGWTAVIHPDDLQPALTSWQQSIATGMPHEAEWRLLHADGSYRWFHNRVEPLGDDEGHVVRWYGLLQDIDDEKNAEEAARMSQSELAHITRVMTMGELAASIAHEVNQPLSGVVINGNACLRWLAGDPNLEEAREAVQRIIRDGKRAADVVARIRTLTTKRTTSKEPLDLNEAIREVVALAEGQARRNRVSLRMESNDEPAAVLGDRVQLQQVVLNLIMNGLDAMITVGDQARELVITTHTGEGNQVAVAVRDSGIGLEPQNEERIFTPFYTTKPEGMGMGLSISRSIIQNHGGRLWATANDGPGATFQFTVPKGL
jgi:PAS domain S-box-containing protein